MPNQPNSSVDAFLRFVNERFGDFKNRLQEVISVLGWTDQKQKLAKAKDALQAARSLKTALAAQDQPQWLPPLTVALDNYCTNEGHPNVASSLIQAIGGHLAAVSIHQWAFDFSGESPFDFDGLYHRYETESRIPELFDKLVGLLEEIVQSDQIDSRKLVDALRKIIASLKKNRNASYFSVVCTWDFVRTYLKNFAWKAFTEIPFLKVPVEALRETMREMDDEMSRVQAGIQTELHEKLQADFPVLAYQPLPLPEPLALPDDTVIDTEAKPIMGNLGSGREL